MRLLATFVRPVAPLVVILAVCASALDANAKPKSKLDRALERRAAQASGRSRIIVRFVDNAPSAAVESLLKRLGGSSRRALRAINGHAGELPDGALAALESSPLIAGVSVDRPVMGTMERTAASIGADSIRTSLGYDGAGIGVAIIDSGIARWHDDLTDVSRAAQRVVRFVDFVNDVDTPYDDYGHGTHVAGIVAGNGYDSGGARVGIAPGAHLVVLKALDATGTGYISDVIAAIDYVIANKHELNVRVINLSIRAGVYESYDSDPLTLAAQRAVREGIVVVAAAGNMGRSQGRMQYGGITAPGNAPWVLTIGASSHMGTVDGADDTVATFSSRGPGVGGYSAKPDLVAPGVGIESLSAPDSTLYNSRSQYLLSGTIDTPYQPYLSLSGTSMAAPVVTGTVALMLQANPALTPNQVKAILQYTAMSHPQYDALTQGAGFLNGIGAVSLARHFAAPDAAPYPDAEGWSRRVVWGNRLVQGGRLSADANAWPASVMWGAERTPGGFEPQLGVECTRGNCDNDHKWTEWGVSTGFQNVVWGTLCEGNDCQTEWTPGTVFSASDGVVWGMDNDAVVWGVNDDGVVWGLDNDSVVWGMVDDGVVWGMNCPDESCEPVVWGKQ
jgi:serine protease AprX